VNVMRRQYRKDLNMREVSAQVVLTPTGVAVWRDIVRELEHEGFECGSLVANNFSIAADVEQFNRWFHVHLTVQPNGAVFVEDPGGAPEYELPRAALPEWMRAKVVGIFFTRLPDFGPTSS